MKSTRERILHTLLTHPRSTINDLARAVGINAISVRHHLTSLQADSLVAAEEERHGVGRPRLVYFLTEQGLERFPTRYFRLTNRLLEQLKETLPSATVEKIFSEMAEGIVQERADELAKLTVEQRLDLVKEMLAEEGFSVEWEKKAETYEIHEVTCPYFHVGQSHPEVCTVDQTLISRMLEVPAEKVQCVLRGDSHCTYIIPRQALKGEEQP
jgi:predicted ArsR family transcriptional regulator